jgi:hypothetical protein
LKLIGLMPVRNEDWVLGLSARVALQWCDELVIFLHACCDRSESIVYDLQEEFPGRVKFIGNDGDRWDEMAHRQHLIVRARHERATHIAIVDADEILTGNLVESIRGLVESMPRGSILQLPGYNLRGDLSRYHANGIWGNRWFSVAFADDPRLGWRGDRFHHREPMGPMLNPWMPTRQGGGGVLHLWGLSERRLIAKHAAYKMVETLRWPNKPHAEIDRMYSQAFDPAMNPRFDQAWRYAPTPPTWWEPYHDLLGYLKSDAEPWQEQMCRELYSQHGADRFAGLDLFDVCGEGRAQGSERSDQPVEQWQ